MRSFGSCIRRSLRSHITQDWCDGSHKILFKDSSDGIPKSSKSNGLLQNSFSTASESSPVVLLMHGSVKNSHPAPRPNDG